MACFILPKPGTPNGPCAKPCQHRDCAATRRDADAVCPGCKHPIGYVRAMCFLDTTPWHNACAELAEERRQSDAVTRRDLQDRLDCW